MPRTASALAAIVEGYTGNDAGTGIAHVNAAYDRILYGIDPRSGIRHRWSFLKPMSSFRIWKTVTGTCVAASTIDTVIVVTEAIFYASMIGHNAVFTATGNSYPITAVTSTTQVSVTGDPSAEANEDVVTVTADGIYDLGDDFGGMIDAPVYKYNANAQTPRWQQKDAEWILGYLRDTNGVGSPYCWAVVPETFVAAAGHKWKFICAPLSGYDRDVWYRYQVRPAALTDGAVYPVGGVQMDELLRVGSLSDAEGMVSKKSNFWGPRFDEAMAGAIDSDMDFDTQGVPSTGTVDAGMGVP